MDHIRKLFSRIPKKHRVQIIETINCLVKPTCRNTLDVKKLTGSDMWRVRSGQYRIIFHYGNKNEIIVEDVRRRDENTYKDV